MDNNAEQVIPCCQCKEGKHSHRTQKIVAIDDKELANTVIFSFPSSLASMRFADLHWSIVSLH